MNPARFLETPDVPGEDGINTYYSRELVLECIDSALLYRQEPAVGEVGMAAPAVAQPTSDQWRDAIEHELSCLHSTIMEGEAPRDAISRLIAWHVGVALDPAVSEDARALIERSNLAAPAVAAEPDPWQPIETAPRDETRLLLRSRSGLHADGYWLRAAYNGNGAWVWPYVHANPIEWMPLPAPPAHLCKPGFDPIR